MSKITVAMLSTRIEALEAQVAALQSSIDQHQVYIEQLFAQREARSEAAASPAPAAKSARRIAMDAAREQAVRTGQSVRV